MLVTSDSDCRQEPAQHSMGLPLDVQLAMQVWASVSVDCTMLVIADSDCRQEPAENYTSGPQLQVTSCRGFNQCR